MDRVIDVLVWWCLLSVPWGLFMAQFCAVGRGPGPREE